MIPYSVYKVMHLLGVMMVFLAFGGITMHVINGGTKEHKFKKPVAITHGIGLLLALVGGFGALARLGLAHDGLPVWILLKVGIWFLFAGLTAVIIRKKQWAKPLWVLTLLLGATASYLAGSKPLF